MDCLVQKNEVSLSLCRPAAACFRPVPDEVAHIAGRQHQFVREGCGGDLHVVDAAGDALGPTWLYFGITN